MFRTFSDSCYRRQYLSICIIIASLTFPELGQSLWQHAFARIRQRITDPTITHVQLNELTSVAVGFTLLSITA